MAVPPGCHRPNGRLPCAPGTGRVAPPRPSSVTAGPVESPVVAGPTEDLGSSPPPAHMTRSPVHASAPVGRSLGRAAPRRFEGSSVSPRPCRTTGASRGTRARTASSAPAGRGRDDLPVALRPDQTPHPLFELQHHLGQQVVVEPTSPAVRPPPAWSTGNLAVERVITGGRSGADRGPRLGPRRRAASWYECDSG
jgi:hypothetical protein